jgi:hypothetical protein
LNSCGAVSMRFTPTTPDCSIGDDRAPNHTVTYTMQ